MAVSIVGSARRGPNRQKCWWALAVLVATESTVVLDVAIVNVALPTIKTDLDFSQESLQWVITATRSSSAVCSAGWPSGRARADAVLRRRPRLFT